MTSAAPLFAITGRGNDVKRARDLITSIGGALTMKEQVADYLVVVKGAGRRKVEYYYHQNHQHDKRDGDGCSIRGEHPPRGRLLLLDMLEHWSTHGRLPQRDVSVAELEEMHLFSAAGAERGQRSYDVPEGFLKRPRVMSDPSGNTVDESDNAVLLSMKRGVAPHLVAMPPPPPPPPPPAAASSSFRPQNFPSTMPLAGPVVFRMPPLQKDAQRRGLLLDDDSPPLKAAGATTFDSSSNNGVVNPMRVPFQRQPKPDWDTYFSDLPGVSGSVSSSAGLHRSESDSHRATTTRSNMYKKTGNTTHSSRSLHVDPHHPDASATATAALSNSACVANGRTPSASKATVAEAANVLNITRHKKNSIEMTFDFAKNGSRGPATVPRCANGGDEVASHELSVKKGSEEKVLTDVGMCEPPPPLPKQQPVNRQQIQRERSQPSCRARDAASGKPRETRSVDLPISRQPKVNRDEAACRRTGGSGALASDGTFGIPPPLPSRPRESGGMRSTTGAAKTMLGPAGRKSVSAASRFVRPSAMSTFFNTSTAASAVATTTTTNSKHTSRTVHSNPLLQRVRQSAYCKGISEENCVTVLQQVVDRACPVSFSGIAGLEVCKRILYEAIILPAKCPQLFTGLRRPCSGLLLFGPPGNGKTLLASAVAKECDTIFFSISAAAITSKWVGEGEKMVRALFAVARALAPSTIFVDEIDALLQARGSAHEGEGSRRIKTEFLVQMDGAGNDNSEARVLVMGATNRPFDLDEAIIRRFPKRVFVPLPDAPARAQILQSLLDTEETPNGFTPAIWQRIVAVTEGYSGHDLRQLCEEVAMVPVRELLAEKLRSGEELTTQAYHHNLLRPLTLQDVETCVKARHPSCCPKQLKALNEWSDTYGSR
ncbi:putative AAA ATPase [Trypanosoma rangeli]|uniref:Putative AAA ATPase n=1 Tax=Trypanosoma rangeli TaxID=5698 RepID=A0A422P204_TRYRA|nr:putative AAA ATPase [Trypanosoma rangeli]RNF11731.1 putative AAA ATPase [Trypanosoma rangeli]|eukprot:RNF11731.1 putative AAA ATPase [Trypanosoma rangeli]